MSTKCCVSDCQTILIQGIFIKAQYHYIGENIVCRSCYYRIKKISQTKSISFEKALSQVNDIKFVCNRKGCFKKASGTNKRFINEKFVCSSCYEMARRKAQKESISIEQAFLNLGCKKNK